MVKTKHLHYEKIMENNIESIKRTISTIGIEKVKLRGLCIVCHRPVNQECCSIGFCSTGCQDRIFSIESEQQK